MLHEMWGDELGEWEAFFLAEERLRNPAGGRTGDDAASHEDPTQDPDFALLNQIFDQQAEGTSTEP